MIFERGQKVMIVSKSIGRDYIAASHDIPYRFEMDNNLWPIGWIAEIRQNYIVVAYYEGKCGIDYYKRKDLRIIPFLEDDLFEI